MTRNIHTTCLNAFLQVPRPKSKRNMRIEWKIIRGCFKNKKEKKHEEIEFHNSVKIELSLPFASCRKMLGKIPE